MLFRSDADAKARFDDIEKDRADREAEAIKQREIDDAARAKRDAEAKAAEDAAVAQHAADAAKAEKEAAKDAKIAEEKRKKEEMQRDMGIDVDPNAVLEPPVDLEKQAEKEAPTEIISTDSSQPFVWHGSETVGSSDVAADDGIASYTPAETVDPEAAMMTSNTDAREQAIAAAEAAALKVKENALGAAATNAAGGADAAVDPAPARVSEAMLQIGRASCRERV